MLQPHASLSSTLSRSLLKLMCITKSCFSPLYPQYGYPHCWQGTFWILPFLNKLLSSFWGSIQMLLLQEAFSACFNDTNCLPWCWYPLLPSSLGWGYLIEGPCIHTHIYIYNFIQGLTEDEMKYIFMYIYKTMYACISSPWKTVCVIRASRAGFLEEGTSGQNLRSCWGVC